MKDHVHLMPSHVCAITNACNSFTECLCFAFSPKHRRGLFLSPCQSKYNQLKQLHALNSSLY